MAPTDAISAVRSARFGPLTIAYDDRVLTPRGWTELQSLWAADLSTTAPDGAILELCAGAGQIGLLAVLYSDRDLVAVDVDERACGYARANARAAGLSDRVEVRNAALESACREEETFPLIIADPPWVPGAETGRFPEDPLLAIDGGPDGLDVARACLEVIEEHLDTGGSALLQLGSTEQAAALGSILTPALRIDEVRSEEGRGVVVRIVRTD